MFHEFINKYTITASIRTTTAIHIGSAKQEFVPSVVDNAVIKDVNGMPFIPGSSLKGVLRSYLEKLLKAMGKEVCMIPDLCSRQFDDKSKREKIWNEIKKDNTVDDSNKQKEVSKYMYERICPICRIFGSNINSAKLMVRDAKVKEEEFVGKYEIRAGVTIDRDKNIAAKGNLYEVEVVPADTIFEFKAAAENMSDEELQYLFILLRSMEEGNINIGGMTSRGLGEFKLENIEIEYIDKDNILDALLKKAPLKMTMDEFEERLIGKEN